MKVYAQSEISDLDELDFELEPSTRSSSDSYVVVEPVDPNHPNHYINNKELYAELVEYHKTKIDALERGDEIPPLTNKIAKAIIQIAHRRCSSWRYNGYSISWKQEMISNAIMLATIHGHNFDPKKSTNPFAYFTQIVDNGIKDQLNKEKLQLYVRYASMEDSNNFQVASNTDSDFYNENDESIFESYDDMSLDATNPNQFDTSHEDRLKYITDYEERANAKRERQRRMSKKNKNVIKLDTEAIDE